MSKWNRKYKGGLSEGKPARFYEAWTAEENEFIIDNWWTATKVTIAAELGRTVDGVLRQADRLRAAGQFPDPPDAAQVSPRMAEVLEVLRSYPEGSPLGPLNAYFGYSVSFTLTTLTEKGLLIKTGTRGHRNYTYTGKAYVVKESPRSGEQRFDRPDPLVNHLAGLQLTPKQQDILRTHKGDSRRALAQALGITKTELNHLLMTRRIAKHVGRATPGAAKEAE